MKKSLSHLILVCLFLSGSGYLAAQQQLVLELANGTVENHPVSEIRSIKFGSASIIIRKNNGSSQTRNINNIIKYSFQDVSSAATVALVKRSELSLFPNPARYELEIEYSTVSPETIRMEILSLTGVCLQSVFDGFHQGRTKYHFGLKLQAGMYLCRVSGESGIQVKPFFIQ